MLLPSLRLPLPLPLPQTLSGFGLKFQEVSWGHVGDGDGEADGYVSSYSGGPADGLVPPPVEAAADAEGRHVGVGARVVGYPPNAAGEAQRGRGAVLAGDQLVRMRLRIPIASGGGGVGGSAEAAAAAIAAAAAADDACEEREWRVEAAPWSWVVDRLKVGLFGTLFGVSGSVSVPACVRARLRPAATCCHHQTSCLHGHAPPGTMRRNIDDRRSRLRS